MTGQTLDRNSNGILVLIIPVAFAIIVVYKFWPLLLGLAALIIAWKAWENYQWRKWSEQVNPYFNKLIRENKGYLTPLDLSVKGNLSAKAATAFLKRKSKEYGIAPKELEDRGVVYYFPTASALGSIFDESEPLKTSTSVAPEKQTVSPATAETPAVDIATNTENTVAQNVTTATKSPSIETAPLNQADLAKRLDVNSSTVGRNKVKSQADFAAWSRSRDPEDIAWQYLEESSEFVPLED